MIGWIIFGGVVLLIAFLLFCSVYAVIDYEKQLNIKVKYLFFTIYPLKPKKKSAKRKKNKKSSAAQDKKADNKAVGEQSAEQKSTDSNDANETANQAKKTENPSGQSPPNTPSEAKKEKEKKLGFDLKLVRELLKTASPPVRRLFRKIRLKNVYVDIVVGTDDAAKTAMQYGTTCMLVNSFFAMISNYITVKIGEINIEADFGAEKTDYFAYGVVKMRLSTALGCALWLLVRLAKMYLAKSKETNNNANNQHKHIENNKQEPSKKAEKGT